MGLNWIEIVPSLLAVTRTHDLAPEYVAPVQAGASFSLWLWIPFVAFGATLVFYLVTSKGRLPVIPINDDLTLELCRAHGIGLQHRRSLDHVAQLAGLNSPAQMFLSEKCYDEAVAKASRKKRLGTRQRGLIFEVRHYLYGRQAATHSPKT